MRHHSSLMIWFRLHLIAAALGFAAALQAAEPAIIARARAFVGPEAALAAVKSLHYTGTLVTTNSAEPSKQERAAIEIVFQRPEQQRITSTSDKIIEVTSLDGYEGWTRVQDAGDPTKWRQTLLGPDQVKRLRAQTWENLAFFRGIERVGGRVEDQGPATVEGVACQKIAFIHGPNIIFYRFFDVATGRLVSTETENGGISREQGEWRANGIRFPKTLTMTTKNAAGQTQIVTINFEKVTVNETFPAKLFAVPAMAPR
ncbi:MAG: hypothetical protein HY736_05335 [Verrucomicrobia bacterium]|nr:hypothetical protein [Verrucomicrobiota bacterium]